MEAKVPDAAGAMGRFGEASQVCPGCRLGRLETAGEDGAWVHEHWSNGLWRRSGVARLTKIVPNSLNQRQRGLRFANLANEPSAELRVWNVFSWLEERGLLGAVAGLSGVSLAAEPQVFYWGAHDRQAFPLALAQVLRGRFQEAAASLTEPDVMLVGEQDLVLYAIPGKDERPGVDRYVSTMSAWFQNAEAARSSAHPDLVRLWAVGATIAERLQKRLTLVALGEAADFADLVSGLGTFRTLGFPDALAAMDGGLELMLKDAQLPIR